jgi:ethanolamine ammonia-lyase small subunit
MTGIARDPWQAMSSLTPARIAIGRAGASLPTREVLSFALSHAKARDAVHARLDVEALTGHVQALGFDTIPVASRATDRAIYLRRPDLGRRLDAASKDRLVAAMEGRTCDVAIVVGDGLSATAVAANAPALMEKLAPHVTRLGLVVGPVVIAEGARVALGDEVGETMGARLMIVLIGERPGLSAADSLGVYVTYAPRLGRTDAERNCISNVRAGGLAPEAAAASLAWLAEAALARRTTGVGLKDESGAGLGTAGASLELPPPSDA